MLFVVDGRAGPVADDFEIADVLRRAKVPVLLVANKIDDPAAMAAAQEIYQLGLGEPVLVSSVHGLGTGDLLDRIMEMAGADGHGRGRAGRRSAGRDPGGHRRPAQRRQVIAVQRHRG